MDLVAAEPRITAGLLFPCQYLSGTILVTQYSMVYEWRVSIAGPMPFYWTRWPLTLCLLLFPLCLLSFNGLVLWGWGLRTDTVLIALLQPCICQPFLIIIIIIIISDRTDCVTGEEPCRFKRGRRLHVPLFAVIQVHVI